MEANTELKTFRPLTGKQFHKSYKESPTTTFYSPSQPLSMVEMVGFIISIKDIQGGVILNLTDGTATFEVVHWFPADTQPLSLEPHMFVKALGNISNNSNVQNLKAIKIEQEHDLNYLTTHFLLCIHSERYLRKHCEEIFSSNQEQPQNENLEGVEKNILSVVKKYNNSENGIKKDDVVEKLKGRYSEEEINEAFEKLVNDIMIYSADGDGVYFKAAEQ